MWDYNCNKPKDWKSRSWTPSFGPNGDFDYIESSHSQDFKYHPIADTYAGIYHDLSRRSEVYYGRHETLQDIINTCIHESIHSAIDSDLNVLLTDSGVESLDIDQEHRIIQILMWMEQDIDSYMMPSINDYDICQK